MTTQNKNNSHFDVLLKRLLTDRDFYERMRKNPEQTLKESGIELTADEKSAFKSIDWKLSDQELKARLSTVGLGSMQGSFGGDWK